MRRSAGFTAIELIIVIVLCGVLASAFVALAAPQIHLFLVMPQRLRAYQAAADLLDIIVEGDEAVPGLRYARYLRDESAGNLTDDDTLTYVARDNNTDEKVRVTLQYDAANKIMTRSVNGGTPEPIPYYLKSGSGLQLTQGVQGAGIFRYINWSFNAISAPLNHTSNNPVTAVHHVKLDLRILYGNTSNPDLKDSLYLHTCAGVNDYGEGKTSEVSQEI